MHAFSTARAGETTYVGSGAGAGLPAQPVVAVRGRGRRCARRRRSMPPWDGDAERAERELRADAGGARRRLASRARRRPRAAASGSTRCASSATPATSYVPPGRPALHARPLRPGRAAGAGELKVPGYSAYLHPVGDGPAARGRAGRDRRRAAARALQLSLFDVSDLAAPKRLGRPRLGGGLSDSDAEYDHHAFLWWPRSGSRCCPPSSTTTDFLAHRVRRRRSASGSPAARSPRTGQHRVRRPGFGVDTGSTLLARPSFSLLSAASGQRPLTSSTPGCIDVPVTSRRARSRASQSPASGTPARRRK